MAERTINGTINSWSTIEIGQKKDKTEYFKVFLKLNESNESYVFFADDKPQLDNLCTVAPIGSKVQFVQWQGKDNYWNFKKESFKVLELGKGVIVEPIGREILIIRQNAGVHAYNILQIYALQGLLKGMDKLQIKKEFFDLAQEYEFFVLRK